VSAFTKQVERTSFPEGSVSSHVYAKDLLDRSIDSKLGWGSVLTTMTTLGAIAVAADIFSPRPPSTTS